MRDIRESFYDSVGAAVKPLVKNKWKVIKTGKPLFQLDTRHSFIPAMKEIEKYF